MYDICRKFDTRITNEKGELVAEQGDFKHFSRIRIEDIIRELYGRAMSIYELAELTLCFIGKIADAERKSIGVMNDLGYDIL